MASEKIADVVVYASAGQISCCCLCADIAVHGTQGANIMLERIYTTQKSGKQTNQSGKHIVAANRQVLHPNDPVFYHRVEIDCVDNKLPRGLTEQENERF